MKSRLPQPLPSYLFALGLLSATSPTSALAAGDDEPVAPSLPDPEAPDPGLDLQTRVEELERRLSQMETQATESVSPLSINGYVDFGFFAPNGNQGVGWIRDYGNRQFPQYANYGWTFLGDILATTINTRGEVADLGDAPGLERFDSVNSNGAPGFLVNEMNLRIGYQLAENAVLRTSINFVPRSGAEFALGDFFDLDIAEMEYVLTEDGGTSVFVGKMLPVFGIEYKERKSHERFGITPSLVHRYTSGTQLGLKIRSKLLRDWLIVAASVTNNSSSTEQFHFYSEIDQNSGKTLNGRLAVAIPVGDLVSALPGHSLEIGFSGEWGPQDRATNNSGATWFIGADLSYIAPSFSVKGQWIRGHSQGRAQEDVWGLRLRHSGYLEFDWMVLPYLGVLARGEFRDAFVTLGTARAYLTKSMRFTGGVRVVLNAHIAIKAEYLLNREFGGIEEFDNDMFTSSLVLSF